MKAPKEVKSVLTALNSVIPSFDKYPFGNKELTEKVKKLELEGFIKYDPYYQKWVKGDK